MREFTPPSFPIYMYDKDGEYKVLTIGEVGFFLFLSLSLSLSRFVCKSIDSRVVAFAGFVWP